jgi:hypothetical protein
LPGSGWEQKIGPAEVRKIRRGIEAGVYLEEFCFAGDAIGHRPSEIGMNVD